MTAQPDHDDRIVGHATFQTEDGGFRHEPLTAGEADAIWKQACAERERRAETMPDERAAINAMWEAWQRLKELGWKEAIYCPKDGTVFDAIEPVSTGIQSCYYDGEWPDGHWWAMDTNDLWPSRPILFRLKSQEPKP